MKLLRIAISIIFVAVAAVFAVVFIGQLTKDKSIPVIAIENEMLDVSLKADDAELLQGVTASDKKDGDITYKVIVESVSKFIDTGVCRVTYAVCDSDNHVAKATRKIRYTEYTPPKFFLTESLCYSIYENVNLTNAVRAWDKLDGDIATSVILTSDDFSSGVTGVFTIKASVTNKNGDTSEISLPLIIEDRSLSAPVIELESYLEYVKKGTQINFADFITGATDAKGNDLRAGIRTESNIDFNKEGTYMVHYYVTDENGLQGHSVLNVIVGN